MKRGNPYVLKVSSHVPPWATVNHVGRKSGHKYTTPVVAFTTQTPSGPATASGPDKPVTHVVHVLPWGPDVDWCRNIRAAGSYTLTPARGSTTGWTNWLS